MRVRVRIRILPVGGPVSLRHGGARPRLRPADARPGGVPGAPGEVHGAARRRSRSRSCVRRPTRTMSNDVGVPLPAGLRLLLPDRHRRGRRDRRLPARRGGRQEATSCSCVRATCAARPGPARASGPDEAVGGLRRRRRVRRCRTSTTSWRTSTRRRTSRRGYLARRRAALPLGRRRRRRGPSEFQKSYQPTPVARRGTGDDRGRPRRSSTRCGSSRTPRTCASCGAPRRFPAQGAHPRDAGRRAGQVGVRGPGRRSTATASPTARAAWRIRRSSDPGPNTLHPPLRRRATGR